MEELITWAYLMKQQGKHYHKWQAARKAWFIANAQDSYTCYICTKYLPREETILDHIKPRGSHPQLRYELSNLAPCCYTCNSLKGSKSLERFLETI